jgi:hypothetical protein
MAMQWLNELGDRNPQLLRELRARFKLGGVGATIGIVLMLQVLIVLFFVFRLSDNLSDEYCLSKLTNACAKVDWRKWWADLFKILTIFIPYVICIPGIYALTNDISQEAQKGTLNFLRLSPRSSYNILLGKLIGVPILGYVSLALMMPLQLLAAALGSIPIGFLLSFYAILIAETVVLFLIAMFIGFSSRSNQSASMGNAQGLVAVIFSIFFVLPTSQTLYLITLGQAFRGDWLSMGSLAIIKWFGASLSSGVIVPHLFCLANFALISCWLWSALQRSFQNPTATLLSKLHSYGIMLYGGVLLLGFVFSEDATLKYGSVAFMATASIFLTMVLLFAVATPRQILLDWLRNRQEVALVNRSEARSPASQRSEQIRDLILGEKSPGITAIGVNLLIASSVMLIMLPRLGSKEFSHALIAMLLTITLVVNYGLLVQLMLMMKTPKRNVWAFGSLAFVVVVPGMTVTLFGWSLMSYFTPGLWAILAPHSYGESGLLGLSIIALMLHGAVLVLQATVFRHQMRQLSRQM